MRKLLGCWIVLFYVATITNITNVATAQQQCFECGGNTCGLEEADAEQLVEEIEQWCQEQGAELDVAEEHFDRLRDEAENPGGRIPAGGVFPQYETCKDNHGHLTQNQINEIENDWQVYWEEMLGRRENGERDVNSPIVEGGDGAWQFWVHAWWDYWRDDIAQHGQYSLLTLGRTEYLGQPENGQARDDFEGGAWCSVKEHHENAEKIVNSMQGELRDNCRNFWESFWDAHVRASSVESTMDDECNDFQNCLSH